MNDDGQSAPSAPTPRLRFPEFRERWQDIALGQVVDFQSGGTPSKSVPAFWNGSIPWVTAKDMKRLFLDDTEDHITAAAAESGAKRVPAGTVLMLARGMTLLKDVPICVLRRPMSFNQDVKALRPKGMMDGRFLPWLLLGCRERLLRMVDVAGHGTGKLNTDELQSLDIALPSPSEQQKIAECLTSLDAVIAAQGRKVEAMKAHKHGLMQQLFPRDGETTPRLRFPEFRHAGEWEEKRLDELGSLVSGLTYSPADVQDGGLLVLRSSNIQDGRIALDDCVYVRPDVRGANLSKPSDILICVRNGSKALIGKNAMIPASLPTCTHGAFMTVLRAPAPHFVHVLLQTKAYQRQVAADLGATINSINGSQLLRYRFNVPSPAEQRRIADCLGSLDAAIAAETRRLAALRTHKKGLMQQLFPSPEGA